MLNNYELDDFEDDFTEDVVFDPLTEVNELDEKMTKLQYTVVKYVSMYDIKRANIDWGSLSEDSKLSTLWSVGLDVKKYRYITSKDLHVTMEGLRKECVRFICEERSDKEWIKTGLASEGAYLKYKADPSLSRELHKLKDCYLSSIPNK